MYLLDVCGHGVGAALLSVSAFNVLRSQSLTGAQFESPASVLTALNKTFRMEKQNNLYFTIWYGVYNVSNRTLTYASGGHPPALLAHGEKRELLKTGGAAIGCLDEPTYSEKTTVISAASELIILSDGVYEIAGADGKMWGYDDFLAFLEPDLAAGTFSPAAALEGIEKIHGSSTLNDDFSMLKIAIR